MENATAQVVPEEAIDGPPDWEAFDRDILCPLCEYNLRGLIEPRCPECGHRFRWRKLLDTRAHQHPYLFEHHPRHNIRSFWSTLSHSALPRRFWTTLQPTHPPVLSRLLLYWFITVGFLGISGILMLAGPVYRYYNERQVFFQFQAPVTVTPSAPPPPPPPPLSWFISQVLQQRGRWSWTGSVIPAVGATLLWPWLTFLALLLYRASLRQARIRREHVLRCVLYSADVGFVTLLLFFLSLSALNDPYGTLGRFWFLNWAFDFAINSTIVELGVCMLLFFGYRLTIAYRRYLNFPHATAAVIASQVIVGLILFKGYLAWNGM